MRSVAARIARPLLAQRTLVQTASFAAAARPTLVSAPKAMQQQQLRFASSGSLSKEDISNRVLEVLKSFEKVDPAKVGLDACRRGAAASADLSIPSTHDLSFDLLRWNWLLFCLALPGLRQLELHKRSRARQPGRRRSSHGCRRGVLNRDSRRGGEATPA